MKSRGKGFLKRIASVFLSVILVVGMMAEMNLTDVSAADVGTITLTVKIRIDGWDGVSDPGNTNIDIHLWFMPPVDVDDPEVRLDIRNSVEVTGYANVTKSINGDKIIYTYTLPSDTPNIEKSAALGYTIHSQDTSACRFNGLDEVARNPSMDFNRIGNETTCLFQFMDGDEQLGAFYWGRVFIGNTYDEIPLELPQDPIKDNYVFKGWVKRDGTPLRVDDRSLYYTTNTYPMKFYATWEYTGHSHNWSADWENNADAHWHNCTAADCPITNVSQKDGYGVHSWDVGTVTKQPTESETGERLYKCTVCGYEKTEIIPVKNPGHIHDYGTEWKKDDTGHWHECACGDKADEAPHREGNGVVTKEPAETEIGIRSYPCIDCGHVIRTETIPAKGSGSISGNNPGDSGGDVSGNEPGENGGNVPGNEPGDNGGNVSGNEPGDNGGNNQGNDGGNVSGTGNIGNGSGQSSVPGHTDLADAASGVNQESGSSENRQKRNEPKTGDAPRIEIYATIAMISGMLYLYLGDMERGMTEEEKKDLVSRLIRWAKKGGSFRRGIALAAIFFVLFYYHSIGKRGTVSTKELCGE